MPPIYGYCICSTIGVSIMYTRAMYAFCACKFRVNLTEFPRFDARRQRYSSTQRYL